jgi:transcriptional regulator with XRE-family HTH domain
MRQKSGLSLRQAATKIGISNCMISHIEVGREDVPKGRIGAIVATYGFTVEDFTAYLQGRKMPVDYRGDCIEIVKRLDPEKLKSVYALLNSFGA